MMSSAMGNVEVKEGTDYKSHMQNFPFYSDYKFNQL